MRVPRGGKTHLTNLPNARKELLDDATRCDATRKFLDEATGKKSISVAVKERKNAQVDFRRHGRRKSMCRERINNKGTPELLFVFNIF